MGACIWEANAGRAFVGRLETGDDLLRSIEGICVEHEIRAADSH